MLSTSISTAFALGVIMALPQIETQAQAVGGPHYVGNLNACDASDANCINSTSILSNLVPSLPSSTTCDDQNEYPCICLASTNGSIGNNGYVSTCQCYHPSVVTKQTFSYFDNVWSSGGYVGTNFCGTDDPQCLAASYLCDYAQYGLSVVGNQGTNYLIRELDLYTTPKLPTGANFYPVNLTGYNVVQAPGFRVETYGRYPYATSAASSLVNCTCTESANGQNNTESSGWYTVCGNSGGQIGTYFNAVDMVAPGQTYATSLVAGTVTVSCVEGIQNVVEETYVAYLLASASSSSSSTSASSTITTSSTSTSGTSTSTTSTPPPGPSTASINTLPTNPSKSGASGLIQPLGRIWWVLLVASGAVAFILE